MLQEQGRKMKRLSERKAAEAGGAGGPRPTHVSAFFLAQAGLKFLASAAALEGERKGAASAPLLYRQTAALLDTAARSAAAASGPPLVTAATALLCERLAAFARLRSAHLRRGELGRRRARVSAAVERGVGETFSRPSPTDSNVSSTPLPAGGAGGGPRTPPGARGRGDGDGGRRPDDRAAAGPSPGRTTWWPCRARGPEAELAAAAEMQHLFLALSGLARSSDTASPRLCPARGRGGQRRRGAAGAAALLAGADGGLAPAAMLSAWRARPWTTSRSSEVMEGAKAAGTRLAGPCFPTWPHPNLPIAGATLPIRGAGHRPPRTRIALHVKLPVHLKPSDPLGDVCSHPSIRRPASLKPAPRTTPPPKSIC